MRQLLLALVLSMATVAFANSPNPGLTIYAVEIGSGKFYRMDNHLHHYGPRNIWSKFVLPDNYNGSVEPAVVEHGDTTVTIFFSNLEDLLLASQRIAANHGKKIASLTIASLGLPGALWFPMDRAQVTTVECSLWLAHARGKDQDIYNQYYSPISRNEIFALRAAAQNPGPHACMTGAEQWKTIIMRHPELKRAFDYHSEINLLGSLVGMGKAGELLTGTIASLLLNDRQAIVKSNIDFSLNDWSIPEGLGFWNYENDAQLNHFNATYPVTKRGRDVMQKGIVRVTTFIKGKPMDKLVPDQKFLQFGQSIGTGMLLDITQLPGFKEREPMALPVPLEVRIPGTHFKTHRLN